MEKKAAEFKAKVSRHIEDIWTQEPRDIYLLKNGYLPSGAGLKDQYFTPMVQLAGEVRGLGINIFPRLLSYCQNGQFSLGQIKLMCEDFLRTDCGVVGYFGLREFGDILCEFRDLIPEIDSLEDMAAILQEMFTLTNRYSLWMHQIFPWYLYVSFPKKHKEEIAELSSIVQADPGFKKH